MTAIAKNERDLTNGSIFKKLFLFALPLIFTNVLQLLFNATDVAVLGMMVDDKAVGAVSATTSLVHLIVNLFLGLSVGASVVLSKCVGKRDIEKAGRVVGTATVLSIVIGIFLLCVGFFGAETFLIWTSCPENLLPQATAYLRIYFLGAPIILFYNFAAGMLRAVGDTLRPMIFLMIAGVANVGLNVFFIAVFNLTVEGVAIATISSQGISAVLSLIVMIKSKGYLHLSVKKLRIRKNELMEILKVGVPAGLQSSMFSISNVLIQTSVNSLGEVFTIANGVSSQFDGFVYTMGNSTALACMSFVSQNYGARKPKRIKKALFSAMAIGSTLSLSVGGIVWLFADQLCGIMTSSPQVIAIAKERLLLLCLFYFMCGIMDLFAYALRALGRSMSTMIISILCVCVFRIVWLNTVFILSPKYLTIFWSYPISWILSLAINLLLLIPAINKIKQEKE